MVKSVKVEKLTGLSSRLGTFVAERDPFARETLDELLELAAAGIDEIAKLQAEAVARELP